VFDVKSKSQKVRTNFKIETGENPRVIITNEFVGAEHVIGYNKRNAQNQTQKNADANVD
jgi:hypothetical protein